MPITGTPATAGSRIQITQFGMTSSGYFNDLAVARIGGSGRDRCDGLGVMHGSLAGWRLGEALGFGWCAYFPFPAAGGSSLHRDRVDLDEEFGPGQPRDADERVGGLVVAG